MSDWSATTLEEVLSEANACADHQVAPPQDGGETLVAGWTDYGQEWDNESFALVKQPDGSFYVVSESEDSSGHGCICSGNSEVYPSLEDALMLGLTPDSREYARKILGHAGGDDA